MPNITVERLSSLWKYIRELGRGYVLVGKMMNQQRGNRLYIGNHDK